MQVLPVLDNPDMGTKLAIASPAPDSNGASSAHGETSRYPFTVLRAGEYTATCSWPGQFSARVADDGGIGKDGGRRRLCLDMYTYEPPSTESARASFQVCEDRGRKCSLSCSGFVDAGVGGVGRGEAG